MFHSWNFYSLEQRGGGDWGEGRGSTIGAKLAGDSSEARRRGKRIADGRSGHPFMYPMHSQSAVIKLAIPCGDIISPPRRFHPPSLRKPNPFCCESGGGRKDAFRSRQHLGSVGRGPNRWIFRIGTDSSSSPRLGGEGGTGGEGWCTRPRRMTHDSRALHATPFVERRNERNGMERGSTVVSEAIYPFLSSIFPGFFISPEREGGNYYSYFYSYFEKRKEKKKRKEKEEEEEALE